MRPSLCEITPRWSASAPAIEHVGHERPHEVGVRPRPGSRERDLERILRSAGDAGGVGPGELDAPVRVDQAAYLVDDRGGARAAAQHLLDLGHRSFGLVLLGVDGLDGIVRVRTRGAALRFDDAPLRFPRAFAAPEPGDTVLGMRLDQGGHLTHGSPVNFSGRLYHFVAYGVDDEQETLDYDALAAFPLDAAGAAALPGLRRTETTLTEGSRRTSYPDASVVVHEVRAETDGRGGFRAVDLPFGRLRSVTATADGFTPTTVLSGAFLEPDGRLQVDVVLDPGVRLRLPLGHGLLAGVPSKNRAAAEPWPEKSRGGTGRAAPRWYRPC